MSFASKYYNVLGLRDNASLKEVKLAYRKLAKINHPDISKDPNAHDKFIAICEAYEYLSHKPKAPIGKGKRSAAFYAQKERAYKEWVKSNSSWVHANAKKAACMNYNDWEKMNYSASRFFDNIIIYGYLILIVILIPLFYKFVKGSKYEEYVIPIAAIFLFISIFGLAYFLTWKDFKVGDIIKKRRQKK